MWVYKVEDEDDEDWEREEREKIDLINFWEKLFWLIVFSYTFGLNRQTKMSHRQNVNLH